MVQYNRRKEMAYFSYMIKTFRNESGVHSDMIIYLATILITLLSVCSIMFSFFENALKK